MKNINTKLDSFLNEMTQQDLAEELKDASNIDVEYIGGGKNWGVTYWKGKEKKADGNFNTNADVHRFLIDNDIDYRGKEGFLLMKRFRDKEIAKIPFQNYQRKLIDEGIPEDLL